MLNEGMLILDEFQMEEIIGKPVEDYYNIISSLGKGKYGIVRKVVNKKTGIIYAAKWIKKRRLSVNLLPCIHHEISVMKKCKSDGILGLHEVFETTSNVILVMEFAAGGDLQGVFDREEFLPEEDAKSVVKQVLESLRTLHSNNIVHMDIKTQNILLSRQNCFKDVKLCDFGISKCLDAGEDVKVISGTLDYISPEVLRYDPISVKADVWSMGVLTYVLLSGYTPFGTDTKQETYLNISKGNVEFDEDLFKSISPEAVNFITSALILDPESRPSVEELLEHTWFHPNN